MRTSGETFQILMQHSTATHLSGASLTESKKDLLHFCSCLQLSLHGYSQTLILCLVTRMYKPSGLKDPLIIVL